MMEIFFPPRIDILWLMTPQQWRATVFFTLCGYFSGSFLSAYYLPLWLRQIDVTEGFEDRNPGTANAFMRAGVPCGILVLLCELGKGTLPVLAASRYLPLSCPGLIPVMLAPVIGHAWSCFYGGSGGKAIAVSFGVLLGLWPDLRAALMLAFFFIFFSVVLRVPTHRMRTIVTFSCWLLALLLFVQTPALVLAGCGITGIVIYKHRRVDKRLSESVHKPRLG